MERLVAAQRHTFEHSRPKWASGHHFQRRRYPRHQRCEGAGSICRVIAQPPPVRRSRGGRIAIGVAAVLAAVVVYALSLVGYHWLASTSRPLSPPDLGTTADTVVVVKLVAMNPVDNRLDVKVLVLPADTLMDKRLDVLNTDISVRLYPSIDLEDLQYPQEKTPAALSTTIPANGDPNRWPFDSYSTETISADVLVGSGSAREFLPARVEVTGSVNGWDIHTARSGPSTQSDGRQDEVAINLQRSKGPLVFDLGMCLVMISLPAMALFVSIETLRSRKKFMGAYATWYTAMLFAVVPLRNFLPGSPPAGALVDQIIVLWALIALVLAMILFIVVWFRHEEITPTR